MEYRKKNGYKISALGLGCYSLSGAYGKKDHTVFVELVRWAFENGVNFFDTADTYGDSAEEILGTAVKPFRNEIYLATKVGIREGTKPNLNEDYVIKACENSLRRLKTDRIDLYQIHFDDPATPITETISALDKLVHQGKIREYGLGHLSVKRIQDYVRWGTPFSVLTELSVVARESLNNLLPYCRQNNLAGIVYSITGRGILTGTIIDGTTFEPGDIRILDPLFQRERFQSAIRITNALGNIGTRLGKTSTQVAINWVLSQPGITCALTGTSSKSHMMENIGSCGWRLDKISLDQIDEILVEEKKILQDQQQETLKKLISNHLKPDPMEAFLDLIYIIETAVLLRIIPEETLYPLFLELFQYRDELKPEIIPKLEIIHQQLREEINKILELSSTMDQ